MRRARLKNLERLQQVDGTVQPHGPRRATASERLIAQYQTRNERRHIRDALDRILAADVSSLRRVR